MPKAALLTCNAVPWEKHWWSRELNRALKRARSAGGDHEPLPLGIVAYTMRHTTISEWLAAGIDIGRVAKAVGTSVVMIEKHYQKFIRADFQDKLSRVAML